jgi:hypothetical protein
MVATIYSNYILHIYIAIYIVIQFFWHRQLKNLNGLREILEILGGCLARISDPVLAGSEFARVVGRAPSTREPYDPRIVVVRTGFRHPDVKIPRSVGQLCEIPGNLTSGFWNSGNLTPGFLEFRKFDTRTFGIPEIWHPDFWNSGNLTPGFLESRKFCHRMSKFRGRIVKFWMSNFGVFLEFRKFDGILTNLWNSVKFRCFFWRWNFGFFWSPVGQILNIPGFGHFLDPVWTICQKNVIFLGVKIYIKTRHGDPSNMRRFFTCLYRGVLLKSHFFLS